MKLGHSKWASWTIINLVFCDLVVTVDFTEYLPIFVFGFIIFSRSNWTMWMSIHQFKQTTKPVVLARACWSLLLGTLIHLIDVINIHDVRLFFWGDVREVSGDI